VRKLGLIIALLFLGASPALAQEAARMKFEGLLNQLLAPGPLIIGHDKLEHTHNDCLKCHEPAGGIPNKNCLECHKEIRKDVEAKVHFHGLMSNKACIDCHKDHKGRNFDPMYINPKTFDHGKTGFELDGSHAKTDCEKCHTAKRTKKPARQGDISYYGLVNSCNKCHMKDDVHYYKGKFKQNECSLCHTTEKWKPAKPFDHGKETGYALLGAHTKHKCEKCHTKRSKTNVRYDFPIKSKQCLSCHLDHHQTRLSPRFRNGKCDVCHSQDTWKLIL
jgi:hypothetical protein